MKLKRNNILALAIIVVALISLTGLAAAATSTQSSNPLPADPNANSKSKKSGVKFFTDKTTYKYGEDITFTLLNGGSKTIWVPNIFKSKWEIVNTKTHEVILIPLEDCSYGNCGDPFTRLEFGDSIDQTWDQFNNDDEHVPAGTYQASATYTFTNRDVTSASFQKVYTKNFKIKKPSQR